MHWGLTSGGWMSGLLHDAQDKFKAQIDLAASKGFDLVEFNLGKLMDEPAEHREQIAGWLAEKRLFTVLGLRNDPFAGADVAAAAAERIHADLQAVVGPMRVRACVTGMGGHHRFEREMVLAQQLEALTEGLTPLAAAVHEVGLPVGVHNSNRGYWAADVAELCRRVPHLGVFWDTANALLMAEQPVSAVDEIAPYIVGTHFKDHYADPAPRGEGLILRARGAVPGEGDTDLRDCFAVIKAKTPNAAELPMLFEIDPIQNVERMDALDRAAAFARELDKR